MDYIKRFISYVLGTSLRAGIIAKISYYMLSYKTKGKDLFANSSLFAWRITKMSVVLLTGHFLFKEENKFVTSIAATAFIGSQLYNTLHYKNNSPIIEDLNECLKYVAIDLKKLKIANLFLNNSTQQDKKLDLFNKNNTSSNEKVASRLKHKKKP